MRLSFVATFCLLFTITLHAQKADSIRTLIRQAPSDTSRVLLYSALANELTKSDPAQSIISARAGLALSLKIDFPKGVFKNYFSLASSFQGQAMFDSAIFYYHCSKKVALFRNDLHGEAEVYSGLGHSFMRKFMMDSARHYLDEGLVIAKQMANFRVEAGIYNNYGNVYLEETNYPKALDYFIAAARLYKDPLNDHYGQCLALSNIGNIEYRLGNYDRALRYADQSMEIAKRKNLTSSIGYAHKLFGRIYRKQKKYQDALIQYQAAQKLYATVGDTRSASELLLNIGNIYFDQENYSDALRNYLQSIPLAKYRSIWCHNRRRHGNHWLQCCHRK